jgi:hypothetical protein
MANSPALTHILHRANGDAEFESGWPGKLTNSTQVLFLFTSEPDDDLAVRQAYCTFASFWNSSMWVTANIYGDKGRTLGGLSR